MASATGYVPNSVFAVPLLGDRGAVGVMEVLDATTEVAADGNGARLLAVLLQQATLAVRTSMVFEDLGRALVGALVEVAGGESDIGAAFGEAAGRVRGPSRQLYELAGIFYELGRVGDAERTAATKMLGTFLLYTMNRAPEG